MFSTGYFNLKVNWREIMTRSEIPVKALLSSNILVTLLKKKKKKTKEKGKNTLFQAIK